MTTNGDMSLKNIFSWILVYSFVVTQIEKSAQFVVAFHISSRSAIEDGSKCVRRSPSYVSFRIVSINDHESCFERWKCSYRVQIPCDEIESFLRNTISRLSSTYRSFLGGTKAVAHCLNFSKNNLSDSGVPLSASTSWPSHLLLRSLARVFHWIFWFLNRVRYSRERTLWGLPFLRIQIPCSLFPTRDFLQTIFVNYINTDPAAAQLAAQEHARSDVYAKVHRIADLMERYRIGVQVNQTLRSWAIQCISRNPCLQESIHILFLSHCFGCKKYTKV